MRAARAAIVVGLLLLALGFAVGTEPVEQPDGAGCGSVLLVRPTGDLASDCPTRAGGTVWLGTWLPLALGGLLLVVGTTAYRERDREHAG